jgi:hypothetical protein
MNCPEIDQLVQFVFRSMEPWKQGGMALVQLALAYKHQIEALTGKPLAEELDPVKLVRGISRSALAHKKSVEALGEVACDIQNLIDGGVSGDPIHPGGDIFVPAGQNPFVYLTEQVKKDWPAPKEGDLIPIFLPEGEYKAVRIGGSGWTPLDEIDPWWGEATVVYVGHPDGSRIIPVHDNDGWGATLELRATLDGGGLWGGRVHFLDLDFEASGANLASIGQYGSDDILPMKDIRFKRCRFFDHPLASVTTTRPISANQVALSFEECLWDLPHSQEHAVYLRNPYKDSCMINCTVKACGGQVWQEVGRVTEGPFMGYPNGTTKLIGNYCTGYHKDDSRASYAITIAGSTHDWEIVNNVFYDTDHSDDVYGALVSWDGGSYYSMTGEPLDGAGPIAEAGKYANGNLVLTDNLFIQLDGNRPILKLDSILKAECRGNGVYGSKPIDLLSSWDDDLDKPKDAGVGEIIWEGNNTTQVRNNALELGFDESLLVEPDLRVKQNTVGKANDSVHIINNEVV